VSNKTSNVTIIELPAATLAADQRVYPADFQLSPTDTADAGKHKFCNGVDTYTALPFIEDAAGGGITALTGNVTASGTGSVVATIPANQITTTMIQNGAVTMNKLPSQADLTLLGNLTGVPDNPSAVTVGAGLTSSAGQLVADVVYENGAPVPAKRLDIRTETTSAGLGTEGQVTMDLSAYSAVVKISAEAVGVACMPGYVIDQTPATYTLQFEDVAASPITSEDVVITLLVTV